MANARQVKQRIGTAKNISKITKAMEMVSASKMRRAQQQTIAARPYAKALINSLKTISEVTSGELHPLLASRETGLEVLLVVSTDRGLCGSLNQNLFKEASQWQKKHPDGQWIAVGKKSVAFAQFIGIPLYAQFTDLPDKLTSEDVLSVSSLVIEKFKSEEFKSVDLVYMDFVNTLSQKVASNQLLPIAALPALDEESLSKTNTAEYVFEPSPKNILDELLPYYVENSIFQAFLEAKASEHSARMVAMKNASENAKDLVKDLQLVYNKSRQESITNELLDITTASLSLTN